MDFPVTATISALTSLLVVFVSYLLTTRRDVQIKELNDRERVNREYLNPLRLQLVENYFRLSEIQHGTNESGKCEALLVVTEPKDVSTQSADWFNGQGCYLISSCYLTACLFHHLRKVREELSYIRLGHNDDSILLSLMIKVSLGYLRNLGVFYVTQPSIGIDMYLREENRLLNYREFCQTLQNPDKRVWFDRLLMFYIQTGQGQNPTRVKETISAIQSLSEFLDRSVGGGRSIRERLEADGIESL